MKPLKRIIEYIKTDIWTKEEHEYRSDKIRWWVRQFKVIIFMAKSSDEHNLGVRSSALTYYTLMSIVPVAALVFGVIKGFGLEMTLQSYLYRELPQFTDLLDQVISFANNMIERAKGGLVAAGGLVFLFWSAIMVFDNTEKAFNNIWGVRQSRSLTRKFANYLGIMVIAPILFVLSSSTSAVVRKLFSMFIDSVWLNVLFWFVSLLSVWILFTIVYRVMPNTRVKLKSAFPAAMVSGTICLLFQTLYFWVQAEVSTYNAIYGTFAALPLFLVWLQASWQILLYGGELSFAYQNIDKYELERRSLEMSYSDRRKVMIAVMLVTIRHFLKEQRSVTSEEVAKELSLPLRIVREIIYDLEHAQLLVQIKFSEGDRTNDYIPARDIHTISLYDVLRAVEKGQSSHNWEESVDMKRVSKLLEDMMQHAADAPENILLINIA